LVTVQIDVYSTKINASVSEGNTNTVEGWSPISPRSLAWSACEAI